MRAGSDGSLTDDLGRLFQEGVAPARDGTLLERYVTGADDSAFQAIVVRHGPMVLGVCRRILASPHDAEDTFQATFLVLARKAGRLRDPDRVGPWLYGVATRLARKARTRSARQRHQPLEDGPVRDEASADWSDVRPILDAELGRLPRRQRDVLVLCLLEGASADEAASRLGCPVGTVKSRLARGRQSLRDRLVSRGIAPAIALAAASAREGHANALPSTLIRKTLGAVASSATATGASTLTRGATWIMSSRSTITLSLFASGLAVVGLAASNWMSPSRAQTPDEKARIPTPITDGPAVIQANNLKQIGLAFHSYASAEGRFPASSSYGPDVMPTLSWRVALLPFLDQADLYRQFHLDEPWDSPHNKPLAARMPAVFETPVSPAAPGETRIRGYVGRSAFFEGTQGTKLVDFTDGTSNTVMVGVAAESVPWTKPGDLPFVEGRLLPALVDHESTGFQVLMTDGSLRSIPWPSARFLPSLITRSGGEVIDWSAVAPAPADPALRPKGMDKVTVPPLPAAPSEAEPLRPGYRATTKGNPGPPAGPGGMMTMGAEGPLIGSTAGPTPSAGALPRGPGMMAGGPDRVQALEQRMQRIESRLDRLIEKLESKKP